MSEMTAWSAPLLNSFNYSPFDVSHNLTSVPLAEAVARILPSFDSLRAAIAEF